MAPTSRHRAPRLGGKRSAIHPGRRARRPRTGSGSLASEGVEVRRVQHVNLTIPPGSENVARAFYTEVLGLKEIPKPVELRVNGGLWYQVGALELHLSIEQDGIAPGSRRHVGFVVGNLERARRFFSSQGIATLPQADLPGWRRFYVHDPFGNRLEIQSPRRSSGSG